MTLRFLRAMAPRPACCGALAALVLLLALAVPLHAAEVTGPEADAVRAVIEAQLAAFGRDDATAAFSYAAPGIQIMFGTPEQFMLMVRSTYAPVYRPRQVFFQPFLRHRGEWLQPLVVTAQDGHVVIALYRMERQPDQTWRIGGVVLLPMAAQGA